MAKTKVILKCRFGKLVPNGDVIEIDSADAKKLIDAGNAVKPPKGAVTVSTDIKKQIKDLTEEKTSLEGQVETLTEEKTSLETQVADLTKANEELAKNQK